MSTDFNNNKRAPVRFRFRATLNIAMGILYLILGAAVATMRKFGAVDLKPALAWGFCILLVLYGVFRVWRGIQDLKATSDEEE
jgi:hypothetical protein